jgi:hypothetical protein
VKGSTKDPHIALIDAHEKLEQIKLSVRSAIELAQKKARSGILTLDDQMQIKAIKAEAIERTKRIQEELYEELESHGKLS